MIELDPEVRLIVDGIRRARSPALSSLPIGEARRLYDKALRFLDIAPDPAVVHADIGLPGARAGVRVYHREPDSAFSGPVLLWLHGGGYCVGSVDASEPVCRMFAANCSCTVVSVGYRLAPEHRFPAAVDDAFDAYRFALGRVRAGTPRQLAIAGSSAGATLALVATLVARDRSEPLPCAQLLICPTALGRRETDSKREFGEGLFLSAQDLNWFYDQYTSGRELDGDFRFAPVAASDLSGLPPTLVIAAECDPLRDDAAALASALAGAGDRGRYDVYAGMIHDFFHMGGLVQRARGAHRDACAFLVDAWSSAMTDAGVARA